MLILKLIYRMAQQLRLVQYHLDCRQTVGREKKGIKGNRQMKKRKREKQILFRKFTKHA